MLFNIRLAIILIWCVQINAQCTVKECDIKGTITVEDIEDEILEHRYRMDKLGNKIEIVNRCENENKVATQDVAAEILQLQDRLDNQDQIVQLLYGKLVNETEGQNSRGSITLLLDCSDISASGQNTSGVYTMYVEHQQKLYSANAFCDMTSASGTSWLVFQRRKDGSVDFYRTWSEYATGFGDPNGEFWLGNEMLHLLTSKKKYKLRVELEDFNGNRRYAEYANFSIGSHYEKYRLNIGGYSGDAGDSFSYHNGWQFSTKDADNDFFFGGSCAVNNHGAWWYRHCYNSNLNGKYHPGNNTAHTKSQDGVVWNSLFKNSYSLKTTEMKIAPLIGSI